MHEQLDPRNSPNSPGKRAILGCPSAGSRLGKGLLPSVGQMFFYLLPKVARDTKSLSSFKREFLRVFLIHKP